MFYKLIDQKPVRCATGREWADWFEQAGEDLIVGQDEIEGAMILTVFTGIDQSGSKPPMLFETVTVAEGTAFGVAIQTASWDDAEDRHFSIVREMEKNLAEDAAAD